MSSPSRTKGGSRARYAGEELRMILQAIVEPILVRFEADEDAGRAAMTGDQDFLSLRQA